MFLLKVLKFFLPVVGVFGNYFELSELILRTLNESDSVAVYFIGNSDGFLNEFMKINFDIPVAIFTSPVSDDSKGFFDNPVTLVVEEQSASFDMLQQIILQFRVRKFVIISASNLSNLRRYLCFFSANKFTRIFGISENVSYAYLPYAEEQVQKIVKTDALPDALGDLNGLTFRTTVQKDIPRTFMYTDKNEQRQVGGYFGQIFVNFLRKHNATFKDISLNNSTILSIPAIRNATKQNEIDISMNGYIIEEGLDYSYPVRYTNWGVMVPLNKNLDPNQYFLRPFSLRVWLCIGVALVYIILMDIVKDSLVNFTVDVWHSFSRTFLVMLNIPTDRPITAAYRLQAQVLVFAFIIGNIYVIHFTSFLTVYIKVKQFDTVQDLIDNNVRVLIPTYQWDFLSDPEHHPPGFESLVTTIDYPSYYKARNSMRNTSFAYTVGSDRGKFLLDLQALHVKPLFHLTRDDIMDANLVYLLPMHSPFKEILNDFVIRVKETGLIEKWDSNTLAEALSAGFEMDVDRGRVDQTAPVPLTVDHLRFAWICWAIGLSIAAVVLMGEHIWRP